MQTIFNLTISAWAIMSALTALWNRQRIRTLEKHLADLSLSTLVIAQHAVKRAAHEYTEEYAHV